MNTTQPPDLTLDDVGITAPAPTTPTPAQAAYAVRQISVSFQLGTSEQISYAATSADPYNSLRIICDVESAIMPHTGATLYLRIYGMSLSDMNLLSKAGLVYKAGANYVTVQAGDAISGMTTIFTGTIIEASPNFANQPNTFFYVWASPSQIPQLKPVPPTSSYGATPVSTALGQIAASMGATLENNGGVNAVLQSPYFPGTAWSQALSAIRAANCFGFYDGVNNVLAIWPKGGSRGGTPAQISAATGMVGYPAFQLLQVTVRTLFAPSLFPGTGPGHQIQVTSELTAANGVFVIANVTHNLASQLADGPWFTTVKAFPAAADA